MLTRERAIEMLSYDPDTGEIRWKKRPSPVAGPGDLAGCIDSNGYVKITLDRVRTYGHRIAFLIMEGWEPDQVDHKNLVRSDNRWENLRPATNTEQRRNTGKSKANTTGYKGVTLENGRYRARIKVNGKKIHLGSFSSAEEAHTAYRDAANRYFGEFARAA